MIPAKIRAESDDPHPPVSSHLLQVTKGDQSSVMASMDFDGQPNNLDLAPGGYHSPLEHGLPIEDVIGLAPKLVSWQLAAGFQSTIGLSETAEYHTHLTHVQPSQNVFDVGERNALGIGADNAGHDIRPDGSVVAAAQMIVTEDLERSLLCE